MTANLPVLTDMLNERFSSFFGGSGLKEMLFTVITSADLSTK